MAPCWMIATTCLCTGCEWIWMPIWVTTFFSRATRATWRASKIVCVSGFWQ